jgi:hypothetical protein
LLAVAVAVAAASGAWAQSRSSTTVNGVTITVESEGSTSVSSLGDETTIALDGAEVVVGPGRIEAGGASIETEPFTDLLVSSAGGTLQIVADGQELISLSTSASGGSLEERAGAGDPAAQYDLAIELLATGDAADATEAERLLRAAAEAQLAVAQSNLGHRLWFGDGLAQDRDEGLRWIEAAASQGYPPAMILQAQC